MSTNTQAVSLTILGKEYKIMCGEHEKEDLISSAQQLDQQMREIRLTGKVSGTDRVAVLAALNLKHELIQSKTNRTPASSELSDQINKMTIKIETALKNV